MLFELTSRRAPEPLAALVELLTECHRRIRHFIALACEVAQREDVPPEEALRACSEIERYFREAFPLHLRDEEESIAPRLRGCSPELDDTLALMAEQHDQHAPKLETLLRELAAAEREGRLCELRRAALLQAAQALRLELEAHLELEERLLFPAITRCLPAQTRAELVSELRLRRAPKPPA